MPEYRFYRITPEGHVAGPAPVIECPDDITAVKEAEKILAGHDIEIWKGKNIISYLVSKGAKRKN